MDEIGPRDGADGFVVVQVDDIRDSRRRPAQPDPCGSAGCSTSASTRLAMNRAVRTGVPLRVTSVTSTTPRLVEISTRRPLRVATMS